MQWGQIGLLCFGIYMETEGFEMENHKRKSKCHAVWKAGQKKPALISTDGTVEYVFYVFLPHNKIFCYRECWLR